MISKSMSWVALIRNLRETMKGSLSPYVPAIPVLECTRTLKPTTTAFAKAFGQLEQGQRWKADEGGTHTIRTMEEGRAKKAIRFAHGRAMAGKPSKSMKSSRTRFVMQPGPGERQ